MYRSSEPDESIVASDNEHFMWRYTTSTNRVFDSVGWRDQGSGAAMTLTKSADVLAEVNEAFTNDEDETSTGSVSSQQRHGTTKPKKKANSKAAPELPPASFAALFRYASTRDVFLVTIGILASAGTGVMFPLMLILFGDLTNVFVNGGLNETVIYNLTCSNISAFNMTGQEP